ncbi:hypothetical protein PVAP13_1KG032650 [Panicum virgatum]|uniref:Uncharacterized protein n=1 Tax=Panicum virgatum TaxID=38727 RepID=A0A8T0X1S2_PANVG|nr:hypothetical protein PVAP13_1KG032650 [Panicum virgatum]
MALFGYSNYVRGGPGRAIHPSTYQSRRSFWLTIGPCPNHHRPSWAPLRAGPCALASSGLRSTENRVHGSTPSLLPPPLIVVAGLLLLLPALQTHRPAGPTCWLGAASRLPRGRCIAGDLFYESRERLRLRDGRCAVLGCGFCPVRCGELLRAGGPETGERSGTFFKRE